MPPPIPPDPVHVTVNRVPSAAAPTPALPRRRLALAMGIAVASDAISLFTAWAPPLEWAVDIATAVALFALLGWQWPLLPGLVAEAVPGLAMFPFWTLVVAAIAAGSTLKSPVPNPHPKGNR